MSLKNAEKTADKIGSRTVEEAQLQATIAVAHATLAAAVNRLHFIGNLLEDRR